jgi:hypothetical protein
VIQLQIQLLLLILYLPVMPIRAVSSESCAECLDRNRSMQQRADTQLLMLPARAGGANLHLHVPLGFRHLPLLDQALAPFTRRAWIDAALERELHEHLRREQRAGL